MNNIQCVTEHQNIQTVQTLILFIILNVDLYKQSIATQHSIPFAQICSPLQCFTPYSDNFIINQVQCVGQRKTTVRRYTIKICSFVLTGLQK